jgi:hypothetical protein
MADGFFAGNPDDGGELFATADSVGLYQAGIIPICWPDKLNPRIDFNPVELQKMIWNAGLPAIWQLWAPCPCGSAQAATPDCPQCHGTGKYYHSQQEVIVGVTGVTRKWDQFAKLNPMEPGTANFLIRGEHVPSLGDRITLLNAHIPLVMAAPRRAPLHVAAAPGVPEVLAIETLRYPVIAQQIRIRDEANNQSLHDYGVMYLQGQATTGLPGPLLVEHTDFEVTVNGHIDWAKGDARGTTPAVDDLFSIYYRTRPVYQVQEFPVAFRNTMTQRKTAVPEVEVMPVEFTGRLEWLLEGSA